MTATTERACESAWESSTQAVKRRAWRASVLPHPSPKQETGWTRSLFDEPKTVNFEITWRQFIKLGGGEAINIGVRIHTTLNLPSCFSRSRSRVICSWPELKREMSTWPYNLVRNMNRVLLLNCEARLFQRHWRKPVVLVIKTYPSPQGKTATPHSTLLKSTPLMRENIT